MANYLFRSQFNYSYSAKPVVLRVSLSFSSGTASIVSNTGMGVSSVTSNGTGDFSLNLSRAYGGLMMINHVFNSGNSAPVAPSLYVKTNSVSVGAAPLIRIITNAAGTAANPADGEILMLEIVLNDSSLGY